MCKGWWTILSSQDIGRELVCPLQRGKCMMGRAGREAPALTRGNAGCRSPWRKKQVPAQEHRGTGQGSTPQAPSKLPQTPEILCAKTQGLSDAGERLGKDVARGQRPQQVTWGPPPQHQTNRHFQGSLFAHLVHSRGDSLAGITSLEGPAYQPPHTECPHPCGGGESL